MQIKKIPQILIASSLLLTGCGLLYSEQSNVPVYSNTSSKTGGKITARSGISENKAPTVISNSSSTPDPYSTKTPSGVSEAIEAVDAIDKKTDSVSLADTLKKSKVKSAEAVLRPDNVKTSIAKQKSNLGSSVTKVKDDASSAVNNTITKTKSSASSTVNNTVTKAKNSVSSTVAKANETVKRPAKPTSKDTPAIKTLYNETQTHLKAGNLSAASASMERANRIEPRNSGILFNIAKIKQAQGNYKQAESFASKAAAYSKSSKRSKSIWNFLSTVRRNLGQNTAADSAAKKAATF